MKTILGLLIFAVVANAQAAEYLCHSTDGTTTATLSVVSSQQIMWNDESHSASSPGVFTGVDKAPYSPRNGELQFSLTNFYHSDDQQFILSIPASVAQSPLKLKVTQFLDDDSHDEGETVLNCTKK